MTELAVEAAGANVAGSILAGSQLPATALSGSCADGLGIVVAPSTGRYEPVTSDGVVTDGQLLGHVTGGRGRADEVRSPIQARIRAILVRPRQLVRQGQPLIWLHREAAPELGGALAQTAGGERP